MEYLLYIFRFLYRIRFWVIIGSALVTLAVIYATRNITRTYTVESTVFTGEQSGYSLEGELLGSTIKAGNSTVDNFINIILAETTLKRVSYRLYARNMIHGDLNRDNEYITAADYREIYNRTVNRPDGQALLALIDKNSEDKTVENMLKYEKPDKNNFIYGLFYWNHPHYSYGALKKIQVLRKGSSDLLTIRYSSNDPGIAYNTIDILMKEFVNEYKDIRYGETDKVIEYFRSELARIGHELRMAEDSLTQYNTEKGIINYYDETKEIAAINKEFELREQDVLLAYSSSLIMKQELEKQMDSNTKQLLNNISFVNKLKEASELTGKISEMESFNKENSNITALSQYKNQLNKTTKELSSITDRYVEKKQSKEGIAKSNIVSQWLEQTLALEKAKASLNVVKKSKEELKEKYAFFAPVGSTIKRRERGINFTEQNYLSLLKSYNDALMRKKNLEMTSATLKVLNPPAYPIQPEPHGRKNIVLMSLLGSIAFIVGLFLIIELLDRTLRDKIRTERLTGSKLIASFPKENKQYIKYRTACLLIATKYLSSAVFKYFSHKKEGLPYIVNFLSIEKQNGKTFIADQLTTYWQNLGLKVKVINWETDFNINSSQYMLAKSIKELYSLNEEDIVLVEYPNMESYNVSNALLQEANLNLLVLRADRSWKETNNILYQKLKNQVGKTPLFTLLNYAERDVLETYTGMLPPYTRFRKLGYRIRQLGLTENSDLI
ncbi:hypothetical protein [Bacteroides graminisolvens]|uniref:GumC family protein n=1 Tax=Bacteroides graminisolvens TaxID=477666 RepID=UPI0023F14DC2|nr:hypothetical protein [Bacteroides graminisolvens]